MDRETAEEHWNYTAMLLKLVEHAPTELEHFLYVEAMLHGAKHGLARALYDAGYRKAPEPSENMVEAVKTILARFVTEWNVEWDKNDCSPADRQQADILTRERYARSILDLCQPELAKFNPITDNACFGCKYRKLNEPDYINICLMEGECIKESHYQKEIKGGIEGNE